MLGDATRREDSRRPWHVHSQREPWATKFRVKLLRSQSPKRRDPAARPSSGLHIDRACGESCLSSRIVSVRIETAIQGLSAWMAATGHNSVGTHCQKRSRDQGRSRWHTCRVDGDCCQIRRTVELGMMQTNIPPGDARSGRPSPSRRPSELSKGGPSSTRA